MQELSKLPYPLSSIAEGDEPLDWPNSQTILELCHACVASIILVQQKHNSFLLGPIQPSSYCGAPCQIWSHWTRASRIQRSMPSTKLPKWHQEWKTKLLCSALSLQRCTQRRTRKKLPFRKKKLQPRIFAIKF